MYLECWDTSTGSVRYTQDELESLASSQSCSILGVGGMSPTPEMLGWRVQVGERFDATALKSVLMVDSLWMRIRAQKTKEVLQWVVPLKEPCAG